jgi:hypothetical protein
MADYVMETAAEAADRLRDEGMTLIPLGAPGDPPPEPFIRERCDGDFNEALIRWPKTPRIRWQDFQNREPTDAEWHSWRTRWPTCNWAILTGKRHGIVVVDADSQAAMAFVESGGITRPQRWVDTAKGRHYYYAVDPNRPVRNSAGKARIDIRGEGGYVVAPGSVHLTGVIYTEHVNPAWPDASPAGLPTLTPDDLAAIARFNSPDPAGAIAPQFPVHQSLVGQSVDVGQRNVALAASVGAWINEGVGFDQLRGRAHAWNAALPSPLPAAEVDHTLLSILSTHTRRHEPIPVVIEPEMPTEDGPRFKLLTGADLEAMPDIEWLVDDVLPEQGVAVMYGPPGCGKSFLAFDMACAIAEGTDWSGHHVHRPAPVVYVALEGEAGYKLRAKAWEDRNGRPLPANLRIVLQPFALTSAKDVHDLVVAIREALPEGGAVMIDTLNRASPGMDENTSEGMGLVIDACKALHRLINGMVLLIAHSGKDESKGVRGHSSLPGAVDSSIVVSRDGNARAWTLKKAKDGEDGISKAFALEVVQLGYSARGKALSSCVVTFDDAPALRQPRRLSANASLGLRTFEVAERAAGRTDRLGNALGVHLEDWRTAYYSASTSDNAEAKRKGFERARKELVADSLMAVADDIYRRTTGQQQ